MTAGSHVRSHSQGKGKRLTTAGLPRTFGPSDWEQPTEVSRKLFWGLRTETQVLLQLCSWGLSLDESLSFLIYKTMILVAQLMDL